MDAAAAAAAAAASAAAVGYNLGRGGPVLCWGHSYPVKVDPKPPTPEASAPSPY